MALLFDYICQSIPHLLMTLVEQKTFYIELGERIKTARTTIGLKQEAFADYLNLSRASIVNIEKGRQHPPIHTLWDISKILGVDVIELLPKFSPKGTLSPEWRKRITKEFKGDKDTKEKLFGFLEEVQASKQLKNE